MIFHESIPIVPTKAALIKSINQMECKDLPIFFFVIFDSK